MTANNLLTVATATYKDFPGVYMTLEVLREFHPAGVEVVVLDNAPAACGQTRDETLAAGGRYYHRPDLSGTAASRDRLFALARTPWVMVLDSHVVLCEGAVKAALRYCAGHPDSRDIIQGPLVNSGVVYGSLSHWEPACDGCLWGEWGGVPEGNNVNGPAFEVPMQGLGLYLMRRAAWPGFNPHFFGFGGEEGYIHEKVRRLGGRALCLPALRWRHRFRGPSDRTPYPRPRGDHAWNLLVGHRELGREKDAEIRAHHGGGLSDADWANLTAEAAGRQPLGELARPAPRVKLLGVWYSNNTAPPKLLADSLKTIRAAAESSRHEVRVGTSAWEPVADNPFPCVVRRPGGAGHAAILEQMKWAIHRVVDAADPPLSWRADAVVFLEHDVLYPPDYFDRVGDAFANNPAAPVVSNLDYIGLNATGWLAVKDRHEPMHQLAMRWDFARANQKRAWADCGARGWAYLEPEGDRSGWVRLQPVGRMPSVHVNHARRFTNHGEVCYESDSGGKVSHGYWGEARDWWPGEMRPAAVPAAPAKKKGCGGCGAVPPPDNHPLMKSERQNLDDWYAAKLKTQTDCSEHLPTIVALAAKCRHVTEITAWNKWLVALAKGCPGQVVSHAGGNLESWPDVTRLLGDRFRPVAGDSLEVDIAETDLLVIDTLHQADRVYRELTRHHGKVSKYLVVHCTGTFGERGDDGGPGVLAGLRRFLRENPTWNVRDYYPNNHGLIVLTRADEDRKALPGLATQAKNYLGAKLKQWLKGPGLVPLEVAEERLGVCALCPARQDDRCSACGCYLEVIDPDGKNPVVPPTERGKPGRALHGHMGCPLGKWHPVEPPA